MDVTMEQREERLKLDLMEIDRELEAKKLALQKHMTLLEAIENEDTLCRHEYMTEQQDNIADPTGLSENGSTLWSMLRPHWAMLMEAMPYKIKDLLVQRNLLSLRSMETIAGMPTTEQNSRMYKILLHSDGDPDATKQAICDGLCQSSQFCPFGTPMVQPLSGAERDQLAALRSGLVQDIQMAQVLDALMQAGVVDGHIREWVSVADTRLDQVDRLLAFMSRTHSQAHGHFLQIVRDLHPWLVPSTTIDRMYGGYKQSTHGKKADDIKNTIDNLTKKIADLELQKKNAERAEKLLKMEKETEDLENEGCSGSGRTTMCQRIAKKYDGYMHISMRDILRKEADASSDVGKYFGDTTSAGKLVPWKIALTALRRAILDKIASSNRFVINGFPRQVDAAKAFDDALGAVPENIGVRPVELVLYLATSDDILQKRVLNRGQPYDKLEVFQTKLAVWRDKTLHVVHYYRKQKKLQEVSTEYSVDEVFDQIKKHIEKH